MNTLLLLVQNPLSPLKVGILLSTDIPAPVSQMICFLSCSSLATFSIEVSTPGISSKKFWLQPKIESPMFSANLLKAESKSKTFNYTVYIIITILELFVFIVEIIDRFHRVSNRLQRSFDRSHSLFKQF